MVTLYNMPYFLNPLRINPKLLPMAYGACPCLQAYLSRGFRELSIIRHMLKASCLTHCVSHPLIADGLLYCLDNALVNKLLYSLVQ